MQENLKDILSHLSHDIDQETLLLYLQGKLSAEKQHEIEKQMLDNDFDADAVEGLQTIKDQQRLHLLVHQLKKDLHKRTQKKNTSYGILTIKNEFWLYMTVIIILLLVVMSYIIIRKYLHLH